jgi:5-methylcytosine-specific restriction protein A
MPKWYPEKVEKKHVLRAARHWEKSGEYLSFRNSLVYDVEIGNGFFPPKAISALAYFYATGIEIKPSQFAGAREGHWLKRLEVLGFTIHKKTTISLVWPDEIKKAELTEGHGDLVVVNRYERNSKARSACIKHWGTSCQVCSVSFEKRYGNIGKDFIHVHHLVPLSEIKREYIVNPKEDLLPVCPNCHAMLHKSGLSLADLKLRISIA